MNKSYFGFDILQVCTPARLRGCVRYWDPLGIMNSYLLLPCSDASEAFWEMGRFEEIEKPRFVGERTDHSLLWTMIWISR